MSWSWLYDCREEIDDGYRPLAEIAYRLRPLVMAQDRDDIEMDIILKLKEVSDKHNGKADSALLWFCARCEVVHYWRKKKREARRFRHLYEGDKGEMIADNWEFVSHDPDINSKLDARAVLKALPKRLVQIGIKVAEGERLSNADKLYLSRKRREPSEHYHHATEAEIEQMRRLYVDEGLSSNKIARIVGRSPTTVQRCLGELGLMRHRRKKD